ncbi:MAG: NAD(P)-dependent oxidoreductase [Betaproteobacteria bacterium]|nr:NAD(P)-dependent oxidoreductase [Betaproteobacteria bacterium]
MIKKVAILGMGRMGQAIARRFLDVGFEVSVYNRTKNRSMDLERIGVRIANEPCDAVYKGGLVLSALSTADAVHNLCSGPNGILEVLDDGVHLGLSTISPDAALRIENLHTNNNSRYISVPVQGRPVMAEKGQLIAWVSGKGFNEVERSVVDVIACKTIYLGENVCDAPVAKLALNMLMYSNVEIFCEAIAYISRRGLSRDLFLNGLIDTAFSAPLFRGIVSGILDPDDNAKGSDINISRKDLTLLVSDLKGIDLPIVRAMESIYAKAEENGLGNLDPIAIRRLFS